MFQKDRPLYHLIFNSDPERTKFLLNLWKHFLIFNKHFGELILWMGTCIGPLMMLTMVMFSDLYLVWKPTLFSVLPGSDYKKAFLVARKEVAQFWLHHMQLFHRQSFRGYENIPKEGGALVIYYHACIPIDYIGLVMKTFLERGRLIRSVMDKNMIKMPGAETFLRTFGMMPGGREEVIELLKKGHLVGVAPGGGYEAQLSPRDHYTVMWKERRGFAVVAKEAKVSIIPMFTENSREAYVNMQSGIELWTWLYNKTKAPLAPIYGGFPVKLTSHIGEPIPTDELTVEELRLTAIKTMEMLIKRHQKLPGNIVTAMIERLEDDFDDFEDVSDEEEEEEEVTRICPVTSVKSVASKTTDSGHESVSSDELNDDFEDEDILLEKHHFPVVQLPNGKIVKLAGKFLYM